MYSTEQLKEFSEFSDRHGFKYNSVLEYMSALIQYFKD